MAHKQIDWHNEDYYSHMSSFSVEQWAWEWLRRNTEYQSDWNLLSVRFHEETGINLIGNNQSEWVDFNLDNKEAYSLCNKWKVLYLIDPEQDISPLWKPMNSSGKIFHNFQDEQILLPDHYVLVAIDLRKAITPQLKKAKDGLLIEQDMYQGKHENVRQYISYWPKYIRIFDARNQGAKYKDIVRKILPKLISRNTKGYDYEGNRTAKDYYNTACRLISGGFYKYL